MESQVSNNNTSKKQKLESQLYQIQNQLQELRIQQQELLSNQKQSKYQSKKKSSNNTYNATMNSNASTSVKLPSPNKNDLNIKKFYHPNIEYVISELSMSPYLTRPSAGVKHQKIKCLEKIREYKFNGKKFSDIPLDKLPYQVNVEKMKDEFVNKIMSFNKNDAYTKELRSPTRPTTTENPKTTEFSKRGANKKTEPINSKKLPKSLPTRLNNESFPIVKSKKTVSKLRKQVKDCDNNSEVFLTTDNQIKEKPTNKADIVDSSISNNDHETSDIREYESDVSAVKKESNVTPQIITNSELRINLSSKLSNPTNDGNDPTLILSSVTSARSDYISNPPTTLSLEIDTEFAISNVPSVCSARTNQVDDDDDQKTVGWTQAVDMNKTGSSQYIKQLSQDSNLL